MKKLIIGFFILLLLFNSVAYAQKDEQYELTNESEKEEIVDTKTVAKFFELNLINAGQSPLTKKVSYILEITPLIDTQEHRLFGISQQH